MGRVYLWVGVLVAAIGCIGATYVSGYRAGENASLTLQSEQQRQQMNRQRDRQVHDDIKAIAAETEGDEHAKIITRDVIRYVKTPGRTECRFPDRRVQLKRDAADNANAIRGYDAPAVQNGDAE